MALPQRSTDGAKAPRESEDAKGKTGVVVEKRFPKTLHRFARFWRNLRLSHPFFAMNAPLLSVVLCAHNPHAGRLQRTLDGLARQTLSAAQFEVLLIDNTSSPPIGIRPIVGLSDFRVIREEALGLTSARLRGIAESRAETIVFVDDDNVLSPTYLAVVLQHFKTDPDVGALGGRITPEFEKLPVPLWVSPFYGLLALRDCGDRSLRASWRDLELHVYPDFAPIGAGMAIRRSLAQDYASALAADPSRRAFDRTGDQLVSGGDNDLVMHVLEAGFSVGYEPGLSLTHLIPPRRLEPSYLGALNRSIARSWVRVLALHGIRPWQPIRPATVPLRQWRAWWRTRAWRDNGTWVTWQGHCGTFEGQADLTRIVPKTMPRPEKSLPPS